jgi:2-polyprenyl-3-methyl-5-hydroxy-6-metoxy-1,4-benzoquinol methylase
MRQEIIQILQDINKQFYSKFATSFARSRAPREPGLDKILHRIKNGAKVLDLGCGHGRIADQLSEGVAYTGLDYSREMLAVAASRSKTRKAQVLFVICNLLDTKWPDFVRLSEYQWIFIRAVLHHIPSYAKRQWLVTQAARYLSQDGQLILANWQFLNIKRLHKRLLSWDVVGLSETDVESGDYLLDWKRDGYGIRYVHFIDEEETRKLAEGAGLKVTELFYADGHTNDLTLYALCQKTME